jgi:hypothetical protein
MTFLKVTYRVRAHHMAPFEKLFAEQIVPLARKHDLELVGFWRTLVGRAGEYLELWRFGSVAEFERSWKQLQRDPQLESLFQRSGPMVEDEAFALLESVDLNPGGEPEPETVRV